SGFASGTPAIAVASLRRAPLLGRRARRYRIRRSKRGGSFLCPPGATVDRAVATGCATPPAVSRRAAPDPDQSRAATIARPAVDPARGVPFGRDPAASAALGNAPGASVWRNRDGGRPACRRSAALSHRVPARRAAPDPAQRAHILWDAAGGKL